MIRTALIAIAALSVLAAAGANAQVTIDKKVLSTDAAKRMVAACEVYATAQKARVAIWVLNDAGTPIAMLRMEGTQAIGVDTALMKAKTALMDRRDSDPQGSLKGFLAAPAASVMLQELNAYPVSGGFAFIVDGQVVGAIGVGGAGGNLDPACAQAAIDAVIKK